MGGGMMMGEQPQQPLPTRPRRALRQAGAFAGAGGGFPGGPGGFDPFSFVANSMRYGPGVAFGIPPPFAFAPTNMVTAADLSEDGGGRSAPAPAPAAAAAPVAKAAPPPSPSTAPAAKPAPEPTVVPL